MSSTSILELKDIDLDIDPFQPDDLSILSFSENIQGGESNEVGYSNLQTKPKGTPIEIDISHSAPVSDDESVSDASFFSDISFHSICEDEKEEQPQTTTASCEASLPSSTPSSPSSMEAMVVKLNRSMLRSARTRTLISKAVLPNLRRSKKLSAAHKAQSPDTKHKYSFATKSVILGTTKDNSIGGFLRATKKW